LRHKLTIALADLLYRGVEIGMLTVTVEVEMSNETVKALMPEYQRITEYIRQTLEELRKDSPKETIH
jgi:hypothetical protein